MKVMMIIACVLLAFTCHKQQNVPGQLRIGHTENLEGDYSFAKRWDYPPGVYKNEQGQLSCDGFCPERTDAMKDSTGRIYDDSLSAFYALVDTAHQFHSMQGEAQCREYAGADYMIAVRRGDTVFCNSMCNAATHCSLHLRLLGDYCLATVQLRSIISGKGIIYKLEKGLMRIEQTSWKAGFLKAEFDLDFGHDSLTGKPVSWKGKIYTPILN
jgi:hypothetical protein